MINKRILIGFILIAVFLLNCGCIDEKVIRCITEKAMQYMSENATSNDKQTSEMNNMKILKIKWQRLVSDGQTCPRCGSTEQELEKAISTLKQSLTPLGIEIVLEKDEITLEEFEKDPLKSNEILINDRPLENWIGGTVSESPCCDVCGTSECRTIGVGQEVYEAIPADLIVKAGLLAAAKLVGSETDESCCEKKNEEEPESGCCPK